MTTSFYPKNGTMFVAQWAFDQPEVGVTYVRDGVEAFGVFAWEDPDDDGPYCYFTGSRFECNTQVAAWQTAERLGQIVHVAPILRYF